MVHGTLLTEKLFTGGDFNGHIRATSGRFGSMHEGFGFGVRNVGGTLLLDYAIAFNLVISNSCFLEKKEQFVTFRSSLAMTQISYLFLRKCNRSIFKIS